MVVTIAHSNMSFRTTEKPTLLKVRKLKLWHQLAKKNNMEEITYDIIRNLTNFKNLS
jgi:hypothetical protein